jgi:ubiquinone/menaquinone biosynthesis C-methylase UbiE
MFTDPVKNLKAFGLREDNIVADLGAGTGFYTIAAAQILNQGKVYAIEITKDYLVTIKNKVKELGLQNVEIVWGNVEKIGGTHIGDNIIDAVIASNVFFQVEDKNNFVEEIKRILKKGGRVLFIDWEAEPNENSPFPKRKGALSKEKTLEMFKSKGFSLESDVDAGAHHYGMILVKS